MTAFTHLHVHTQYSILDGLCDVKKLVKRTKELGMSSLAITDHGVMYGVLDFRNTCVKEGIKPILGCEMYVHPTDRFNKIDHVRANHLILLAKNFTGYQNLIKLDSLAFDKDAFYRTSRIDKNLLFEHSEGLICSSACVAGIIPQLLYSGRIEEAEKTAMEYKEVFGDDYYIEMQNHFVNEIQKDVNPKLIALARKLNIKLLATNDVHFINRDDFFAHRILICLSTGKKMSEDNKLQYTGEEYLKSGEEMASLFPDIPDAIANTMEVAEKVEVYDLERAPILPVFDIPESFGKLDDYYEKYSEEDIRQDIFKGLKKRNKIKEDASEEDKRNAVTKSLKDKGGYDKLVHTKFDFAYLKYLTFNGAKKRYGDPLPQDIVERLDMELDTIEWMGFPGYFLIVQDFINTSRDKLGVIIGPGRGSAAGSVVAYCLGITQIEPIKYGLLFERFLNPDRISLPDIDVDFDDEGRGKTLEYVQQKYGVTHVAQVTTFGTMAAKSSIKDVARVMELPLNDSNRIANCVPTRPGITLEQALKESPELQEVIENGTEKEKEVLHYAEELEGSIRNTGVHACGVIIGPDDISNYVPLCKPKDSEMMAVQFEGKLIESVGMIKMDFLGLSNLSIIKDAVNNIYKSTGKKIDMDDISLEDKETLELFARGDSTATFQFESDGMKNYLKQLKPDKFEDLIAMNALYRPGPMAYIPDFINRKHGDAKIEYEFPQMEKYLKDTYGITVYQEQVMQLSRLLANFTPGEADKLRKAMGKKKKDVMAEMKEKYDKGCERNGLDKSKCNKIWTDWEAFASYAFNKSHATCYAYVAFQTGYLKAHYRAEYMSAVLTHNLRNMDNLTLYIADCQKAGIDVLGPNVNESDKDFMVNKKGQIVFGLAAIKSVGYEVAIRVIEERQQNGTYKSAEDFIIRNQGVVNKRSVEALVKSGAFDCFPNVDRAQYLCVVDDKHDLIFIDKLIKFCAKHYENQSASQTSLFGGDNAIEESSIQYPQCENLSLLDKLKYEKEMIGFYISGNPMDNYADEVRTFTNAFVNELEDLEGLYKSGKTSLSMAGLVTGHSLRVTKRGKQFISFTLEDKKGQRDFSLFGKDFLTYSALIKEGVGIFIKGRVQEKTYGDKGLDFKVDQVEYLDSMLNTYGTGVKLIIDVNKLNDELVEKIISYAKSSKGMADITFVIYDENNNLRVTLEGKKCKVELKSFVYKLKSLVRQGELSDYIITAREI